MMLRTTRKRGVGKKVEETKQRLKRRRAPNGEFARQDAALAATTVFDFAWRMPDALKLRGPRDVLRGHARLHTIARVRGGDPDLNTATMFVFEAFIAQRARELLEEVAVHFISRDPSKLADGLIVPRLRALGLESSPSE